MPGSSVFPAARQLGEGKKKKRRRNLPASLLHPGHSTGVWPCSALPQPAKWKTPADKCSLGPCAHFSGKLP